MASPLVQVDGRAFRAGFYGCLIVRADTLFELTDALLCQRSPAASLPVLSLTGVFGHGHRQDVFNSRLVQKAWLGWVGAHSKVGVLNTCKLLGPIPRSGIGPSRQLSIQSRGRDRGTWDQARVKLRLDHIRHFRQ